MKYPALSTERRLQRLEPPVGRVRMVLDTDAYNEVDDQFAIAYALKSQEKLDVEAIYAAPFYNNRSENYGDGMEKSYQEIIKILDLLNVESDGFVYRGSTTVLPSGTEPADSEAAEDLIERAMKSTETSPLYVVAIGAITNIASAILMEPRIIERICIVWLGGQPLHWPTAAEFNLQQDPGAVQVVFDSGVPLLYIPCMGVASHLLTTLAELECYLKGKSEIGTYLVDIVEEYTGDHFAWAKEIWDISAIGYLVNPDWVPGEIVHSPILTNQLTWSVDRSRHYIRVATYVKRNAVFGDLFKKLAD